MNVLSSFKQIDTFIFDIDGVLTNGSVLVLESGEMARLMNVKDGYAIALAIKKGYKIFITSGSSPNPARIRLNNLGVKDVFFRVADKGVFVRNLIEERGLNPENILYMGDDMPDLPVFDIVKLSCCPADAVTELRNAAKYVSTKKGGEGCVRDVIEKVLKMRGDWDGSPFIASA